MRKDERRAIYLIVGVIVAIIVFFIVQQTSLGSGVSPT